MATIAVLGLGIIGSIWAKAYAADGHHVRPWNRSAKPEFSGFEPDLLKAVKDADWIHVCLAGPPSVQVVLDQILRLLQRGQTVIQSSTISPAAAHSFATMVSATGAAYLEAPFTGSKPAAESRQLVFFLGADAGVIEFATPLLGSISRKQFHFASASQAAAIKLAMNLQIAAICQALCEGFHFARKYGISAEQFFAVLDQNAARSGLVDLKQQKLVNGDYTPQFSIKHMAKDLGLALDSAAGLDLHLTRQNHAIYLAALQANMGELDFVALEQLIANFNSTDPEASPIPR